MSAALEVTLAPWGQPRKSALPATTALRVTPFVTPVLQVFSVQLALVHLQFVQLDLMPSLLVEQTALLVQLASLVQMLLPPLSCALQDFILPQVLLSVAFNVQPESNAFPRVPAKQIVQQAPTALLALVHV